LKKRSGACLNVYLIVKKKSSVLLSLRQNTGYYDNYYGLISGHVEDGESAISAMIREAKEEAGIQIAQVKPVHIIHRKTDRFNIDIFFTCSSFLGPITNPEPHKCAALEFFDLNNLPPNIIPYIEKALQAVLHKKIYSEEGWACC
ncbi:MAG: NUDIX domain-containing protein, partial [Verrucomicrobiota bacterium]